MAKYVAAIYCSLLNTYTRPALLLLLHCTLTAASLAAAAAATSMHDDGMSKRPLPAQQIQRVLNSIKIPAFVETGAEMKQAFLAVLEYLLRHGVPVYLLNTGMLPDLVDGPVAIMLANYEPLYVYIYLLKKWIAT